MNWKEISFLAGLAAAIVGTILLVPTERGAVGGKAPAEIAWDKVVDDPGVKLKIGWNGIPAFPSARKGSWIEQNLEAKFSVEFAPLFLDWNSYHQRRPLMFAAGELPDVNWDGDPLVLRRNIHHGFVLELPYELLLKHAPNYVRLVNRYGPESWLYARYAGRNYGIPTISIANTYAHATLWRRDWLDKVGVARIPDNLDQMHEALWKFRHEDPDGDGLKNTYGVCPSIVWHGFCLDVFNAHGVLPQDFQMRDGRAVWGGIQPEAKAALKMLRQWYQEEIIDPDFAVAGAAGGDMMRKFINGKLGYMNRGGNIADLDLSTPGSIYSMVRKFAPQAQVVPARPIRGIDGVRRDRVWGGAAHVVWVGRGVASDPRKVVRVLRMFERLATDRELFLESRIGLRGEHWDHSPQKGVFPLPPYDKRGEDGRNLLCYWGLESCTSFYSPFSPPPEFTDSLLPEATAKFRQEYNRAEWTFGNAIGKSDVAPSAGLYLEGLRQFQTVAYIEIIRGDKPLEYFDEFVAQWSKRGGDVLTREANEMLGDMRKIYRQVGKTASAEGAAP